MKTTSLVFSLFAFATATTAQQPAAAAPKEPFVVEAGEVTLTNLIDRCAAYLDCNILAPAQELAGSVQPPVRLQKAVSLDRNGCEEFLASMLYRSGLALTRADGKGTLEVLNMQGPRGRDVTSRAETLTLEQVLARPDRKMPVSTVVKLQHVNATIATNALRPFFASTGGPTSSLTLGNVGNNSGMVLCGMQDQVVQAIRMLREVDLPATAEEVARQKSSASRIEALEQRIKTLEEKVEQLSKPAK